MRRGSSARSRPCAARRCCSAAAARPAVDVAAAARLAAQVGALLLERGLTTVECNPVLVGAGGDGLGAVAVDAAIRTGART